MTKLLVTHHVDGYYVISTIIDGHCLTAPDDEDSYHQKIAQDSVLEQIIQHLNMVKYDIMNEWYQKHFPLTGFYSNEGLVYTPPPPKAPPPPKPRPNYKAMLERRIRNPDASIEALHQRRGW